MPRRPRAGMGGLVFHVINRGSRRGGLFECDEDYERWERVLREALDKCPMRLLSFCAMPNHFHLIVWPRSDHELPQFMHRLTGTHAMRWRKANGTSGQGVVYQGRYKAIPVQTENYFVTVARYVERNPLRAHLIESADRWRWSSLWHRDIVCDDLPLADWPVPRPADWLKLVNTPQTPAEVAAIRRAVNRGCGLGNPSWQEEIAKSLRIPAVDRIPGPKTRNCG